MQWKTGFTPVKQQSVSNNVFKNHHVNISQLCAGNIRDQRVVWIAGLLPVPQLLVRDQCLCLQPKHHFQSRARQLQAIPSQQRYWLKWWQGLIWNILVTMSGCVILLSWHPAWFMGLLLLLFTMSHLGLKGLVGSDVSWRSLSLCVHFNLHQVELDAITRMISHTSRIMLLCWASDSPLNTVESKINTASETQSACRELGPHVLTCCFLLLSIALFI